jgi:hypothetical protein
MNSPTDPYIRLEVAVKNAAIIVRGVDPIQCRTDLQHLKLQSYTLLCHAAIEEYLEELCLQVATTSRQLYKENGVITKSLVSLISAKLLDDMSEKGKKRIKGELASDIEIFSAEAYTTYKHVVTSNHGIVNDNLKALLLPIGVNPETDIALMASLHSFGGKRGELAHKFVLRREDTLSDSKSRIDLLVRSLIAYDEAACSCIATQMQI